MPQDYLEVEPEELTSPEWFNTLSHPNFGQKLIDEINTATEALKTIAQYVCRSHLTFALSCGEGHLPYKRIIPFV